MLWNLSLSLPCLSPLGVPRFHFYKLQNVMEGPLEGFYVRGFPDYRELVSFQILMQWVEEPLQDAPLVGG